MTETTTGPWHDYLAEADRLREVNADLLAALEAVYDGLPPNRYTSDEAVEIVRQLRNIMAGRQVGALIARARGIGQNIDTRA